MRFWECCVSRMHHLGMQWNATRMQQSRNVVGRECTRMQHIAECNRCRMQHVQNATGAECNRCRMQCEFIVMQHVQNATAQECTRMQTNASRRMHSECTDGNATWIQQPQRMQRVRNASEFYIMLQILNASRTKCMHNACVCIQMQ